MTQQRSFGRRGPAQPQPRRLAPTAVQPPVEPALDQARVAAILLDAHTAGAGTDREVEDWNALRKARKRSFREPWRSVSIVAGLGFAVGSFVLPDSVAAIGQWLSGGLALVSFFAGYRRKL